MACISCSGAQWGCPAGAVGADCTGTGGVTLSSGRDRGWLARHRARRAEVTTLPGRHRLRAERYGRPARASDHPDSGSPTLLPQTPPPPYRRRLHVSHRRALPTQRRSTAAAPAGRTPVLRVCGSVTGSSPGRDGSQRACGAPPDLALAADDRQMVSAALMMMTVTAADFGVRVG